MHKKKLLFISANKLTTPYPVYPLGISYLVTFLKERLPEYHIEVFDFNQHSINDLEHFLLEFKPHYVAISLRNADDVNYYSRESFLFGYQEIMQAVRKTVKAPVIIGGSAFSIFPAEFFNLLKPDYGIRGEGEESLLQLLKNLDDGTSNPDIDGLVFSENNTVKINERRHYNQKPDLEFDRKLMGFYREAAGMANIQTKRGCPHHCIYCTYPLIEGSKVRTLDPDKIVYSLRELYQNHGVTHVFFTDSVFNISNNFNVVLAEKMIAANIPIYWGAYFSPHDLAPDLLKLFARAGLTHVEFGTESLSDTTLKHYGKHFTVDEVVRVSEYCNAAGVYFCHFMIIGGYGETEASVNESFENSKRIANTVFFPFIGMRIYPGTLLQKLAIEEGVIKPTDDLLAPVYYLAPGIDYDSLKMRASATNRRWVFPDEDISEMMTRMRQRKRKGPLWHHLKK